MNIPLINKRKLAFTMWLIFSFFLLIEPVVFLFTKFHTLFRVGQVFVLCISVIICYLRNADIKFLLYTTFFSFGLLLVTYLNDGATVKVYSIIFPIIGLLFTLQYALKQDAFLTVKALYLYFSLVIYINFTLLIFYPEGIMQVPTYADRFTSYHFLSVTNQFGPYLLFGSTISLVYYYLKEKVTFGIIMLNVIVYVTLIQVWSATSIFWITIFYVLVLLINKSITLQKLVNVHNVLIFIFFSHLLIVFLNVQKYFSYLISEVLEKDLTLSGRTVIWDISIDKILNALIFGYGEIQNSRYITVGTANFNAHNVFLQILLQGGLFLFSIFTIILMISLFKSRYCKNIRVRNTLLIAVLTIFNMMISEVYPLIIIFMLLSLIYNSRYLDNQKLNNHQIIV